jgi:hypothetical protein
MNIINRKKQTFTVIILTLLAILSWLPYMQTLFPHLSYGDEGIVVQSAYRIYLGQVPYQDFFTAGTPGSYYWTSLFFSIFGPTFLAVRIGTLIISAIILLTTCFILKACGARSLLTYLLAAVFLAHFGGPYWFIASHHWVALAFSLISLLLLLPKQHSPPAPVRILLSGAFAAATALTLQHLGGLWILCVFVSFFGMTGRERKRYFFNFSAGIALLTIPVAIYFASKAGLSTLFYDLVTFPLTQYSKIEAHQGMDVSYFGKIFNMALSAWNAESSLFGWARFVSIASLAVGVLVINILPLLGLGGLVYLWKNKYFSRPTLLALSAFFCAQYLKVLFRVMDQTLVFAAPASILIILSVFEHLRQNESAKKFTRLFDICWLSLFACVCVSTLTFHLVAPRGLTQTPSGPVYSLTEADYKTLQELKIFFAERKSLNEPIYCHPYSPMLYFLFQTENPTDYDTLSYPMATPEQISDVITTLERTNNRWVFLTTQVEGDPFVRYLEKNYRLKKKLPLGLILEKKPYLSHEKAAQKK